MATQPLRIFIVDDHPLARSAIVAAINSTPEFTVCGEADNIRTTVQQLKNARPDIVVLDISLKDAHGMEGLRTVRREFPMTRILMFSAQDEAVCAPMAIREGASGYVSKDNSVDQLLAALRKVAAGGIYVSPRLETDFLGRLSAGKGVSLQAPVEVLSDREMEIFRLYGKGHSTKEIATLLNVSIKTIDAHRQNIKAKLHLKSLIELIHRATQWVKEETPRP